MIFIGLGANLDSPVHGSPIETLEKCLLCFSNYGLKILKRSHWYKSAPVPISDDPWYINGVVEIETDLSPRATLSTLLEIEDSFGRSRSHANAPRVLDLDLISYHNHIEKDAGQSADKPFCIPHPRMHERAFVLHPLKEIQNKWHHPVLNKDIDQLIAELDNNQIIERIL